MFTFNDEQLAYFVQKLLVEVDKKLSKTSGGAPIGSITLFPNVTSIPDDYMVCDGSTVSRTTYAALFAVIGTTYGSGDGSTTFNLPQRDASIGAIETWKDLSEHKSDDVVYIIKVK